MDVMAMTWTFNDGVQKHPCTSFPFAYRMLYNSLKKGVETGKKFEEMTKVFRILSPTGKVYSYTDATSLATDQGLLTPEGTINSKEFKRK